MKEKRELILSLIKELENISDINEVKGFIDNIELKLMNIPFSLEEKNNIRKLLMYQENDFSVLSTEKSILKAKSSFIKYLKKLLYSIESVYCTNNLEDFSHDTAKKIIRNILNNFYMHIYEMYETSTHKKGNITSDKLKDIKIGNEYDVQRILYSIIKPIFPSSRLEVSDDTGNSAIRYDILIEKYDLIIEVKCSRESMNEKKLTEEIASDAFHYRYKNIFFFIYDKDKIIKNKEAFVDAYSRGAENKSIETIVIQPVNL